MYFNYKYLNIGKYKKVIIKEIRDIKLLYNNGTKLAVSL